MSNQNDGGFLFAELAMVSTMVVVVAHVLVCLLYFVSQCALLDGTVDLVAAQSFDASTVRTAIGEIIDESIPEGSGPLGRTETDIVVGIDGGGIGDLREVRCSLTYYPVYFEFRLGTHTIRPPSYRRTRVVHITVYRPAVII